MKKKVTYLEIEKLIEKITEEVYKKILAEMKDKGGTLDGESLSAAFGSGSASLSSMIDHTLLKPDATEEQIKKLCKEARENKFASVCINPHYVPLAVECLRGSDVKVCTVIGFPLGASTTRTKVAEAKEVVENGAGEVDMVINIGALKSGDIDAVRNDIESVVIAVKDRALVKVIIETCLLTDEEKVKACQIAKMAGADFVKTSTGFSTGGATVEDVKLMRQVVGSEMGVKASGGVRSFAAAMEMIKAGANRLGTSSGVAIVKGARESASEATSPACILCGACTQNCPTGNVQIIKSNY
jgi:deoxyribose-phosphate aldolase